jgi:O-antigen biosynthesis protein
VTDVQAAGGAEARLGRIRLLDLDLAALDGAACPPGAASGTHGNAGSGAARERRLSGWDQLEELEGYESLRALVRLGAVPVGSIAMPVPGRSIEKEVVLRTALSEHRWPVIRHHLRTLLDRGLPASGVTPAEDLFSARDARETAPEAGWPSVTVAICTRNRPDDIARCLEAVGRLEYPDPAALEVLVVDNAPRDDSTERVVRERFPNVRYVREPRPGLDWARNRAILEARGEIIAYTDDDVVVDPGWVRALARVFRDAPDVMCVTGLVVPYEQETEAQILFERYGGFGRGFVRRWWRLDPASPDRWSLLGAGQFGTGANMAFRRRVFDEIGPFDPALDVGTPSDGGGDLELYYRVVREGHTLVYEPAAMVRHKHRPEMARLRKQLTDFGIGLFAYLAAVLERYPEDRLPVVRLTSWWLREWGTVRLLKAWARGASSLPRDLVQVELLGAPKGPGRYKLARQRALEVAREHGAQVSPPEQSSRSGWDGTMPRRARSVRRPGAAGAIAVRTVDLRKPLAAIEDVTKYDRTRLFFVWGERPVGQAEVANAGNAISMLELGDLAVDALSVRLLDLEGREDDGALWTDALRALSERFAPSFSAQATDARNDTPLPADVPVSIVIATYDRPDDLRECLRGCLRQETERPIEIVVVDNHPASGLTAPVVAEFPSVRLITEERKGLSYARNSGIIASTGEIVVATDDDVVPSRSWIEQLVAPFSQPDVMVVTGNTLPFELETGSQVLFEKYGGLGRGYHRVVADKAWFWSRGKRAAPTWELGATANAAFRASVFADSAMGLFDEMLGAGSPTGCSEDTYLFYRVLKAGYRIVYEPSALVWHKHRRTEEALRRQIYSYSKGHVAYHLLTLFRDGDLRALVRLGLELPHWHAWRILQWLRGNKEYPLWMTLLELAGNLAGPRAYIESRRRVAALGRSGPYLGPGRRLAPGAGALPDGEDWSPIKGGDSHGPAAGSLEPAHALETGPGAPVLEHAGSDGRSR